MKRLDFLRRYEPRQVRGSAMLALSAPCWRSPVVRTSIAQGRGTRGPCEDPWTTGPMDQWTIGREDPWTRGPVDELRGIRNLTRNCALDFGYRAVRRGGLRTRAPGPVCPGHQAPRPSGTQAVSPSGASAAQGRMPRWARAARTMCSWPWHISATTSSRTASAGVSQSRLSASRRGEHSPCTGRM